MFKKDSSTQIRALASVLMSKSDKFEQRDETKQNKANKIKRVRKKLFLVECVEDG